MITEKAIPILYRFIRSLSVQQLQQFRHVLVFGFRGIAGVTQVSFGRDAGAAYEQSGQNDHGSQQKQPGDAVNALFLGHQRFFSQVEGSTAVQTYTMSDMGRSDPE